MSPKDYWACGTSWGLFLLARSCFWELLLAWGHRFTLSIEPCNGLCLEKVLPIIYSFKPVSIEIMHLWFCAFMILLDILTVNTRALTVPHSHWCRVSMLDYMCCAWLIRVLKNVLKTPNMSLYIRIINVCPSPLMAFSSTNVTLLLQFYSFIQCIYFW